MNTPKTLSELQQYYKEKCVERGFDKESPQDTMLLMVEEVGELAKAIRKNAGIMSSDKSKSYPIEEELADILMYLLAMSNVLGLNLEESFWKKEEENSKRTWH